jgi:iron complex transport system substrate-binding protein
MGVVAGIIILLFSGCAKPAAAVLNGNEPESGRIVDNSRVENYFRTGINRQMFSGIPSRVLVIGANEIETLIELGVEGSVIAALNYQDNEEFGIRKKNKQAFAALPLLPRDKVNMEYVLWLRPDLIIAQQEFFSKNRLGSTDYWNSKGIYTMVPPNTTSPGKHSEPETIEKEMKFIRDMGIIFHKETRAEEMISKTWDRIHMIQNTVKALEKPKVMILDLISVVVSYDRSKIAGDVVVSMGASVPYTPAVISPEHMIKEDPDVVFVVSYDGAEYRLNRIRQNKAFRNLKFMKNHQLHAIPLKYVYGPETRTLDAAEYMANRIYPELFSFPE